jgi:predicted nucleotidyltransferase
MQRDDAIRLLRGRSEQFHDLGVGRLFLYGSVARDEAREDSDVDLLVEPATQRFSIFDLVHVRDLCQIVLGTTADIYDYDDLRRLPEFRWRVGSDLVCVFS